MGCLKRERILGLVFEIGYYCPPMYFYKIKRLPQSNQLKIKNIVYARLSDF